MSKKAPNTNAVATEAWAVTPHNSTNYAKPARALYVGGVGDVTLIPFNQKNAVLFKAVPVGTVIELWHTRVNSTGTTATQLTALA
jgi:hypothetical protein